MSKRLRLYMIFLKTAFETTFGWVGIEIKNSEVTRSTLPYSQKQDCLQNIYAWESSDDYQSQYFEDLIEKIRRYLSGHHENLSTIPIDIKDSPPFFASAWKACRTIPKGETRSYKWLAIKSGNRKAARAAGQAMAKNKIPLLVPCHRVIGKNGSLTGFGKETKQLDLKERLLRLEQVEMV